MTRSRQAWIAAAALALLALGLLAGAYRLRRDGGAVEILSLADPAGTLYLPESAGAGNTAPAALLLAGSAGRAGQRALGLELSRRGLVVLALRDAGEAEQGWAYLTARPEVWVQRTGVVVLGDGMEPALELAGGQPVPQTVVLLGTALPSPAQAQGVRNVLAAPASAPAQEELEAFLGVPEGAETQKRTGYFSEGTARRVLTASRAPWRDGETLAGVLDWLGSSLGHRIEYSDRDLVFRRWEALLAAGSTCAGLAAAALVSPALLPERIGAGRRKKEPEDPSPAS